MDDKKPSYDDKMSITEGMAAYIALAMWGIILFFFSCLFLGVSLGLGVRVFRYIANI